MTENDFIKIGNTVYRKSNIIKIYKQNYDGKFYINLGVYNEVNENKHTYYPEDYRDSEFTIISNKLCNNKSEVDPEVTKKVNFIDNYIRDQLPKVLSDINKKLLGLEVSVDQLPSKINTLSNDSKEDIPKKLFIELSSLALNKRILNCLLSEDLIYIGDIICNESLYKKDNGFDLLPWKLMKNPNFGPKSCKELMIVLGNLGFSNLLISSEYWSKRKELTGKDF